MSPQTERYLDLVREGRNEWWRYALGVFIIAFCWHVLGYLPLAFLPEDRLADPRIMFVVVNFAILMMLAGVAVTVRGIHGRALRSLVTPGPRIDWRRMALGAAVWVILAALTGVVEQWVFPGRYYLSFDPYRFLQFAVLVVLLTPLQGATEELIFRGYVMQGMGLLTRRPLLIAVASSLVFAVPHLLNPEVQQHGAFIMGANYFAIGMVLATIALRDGRLELAIGVHAINNVFLALVANYEGSVLTSEAIFTARELDPWFSLVTLVVGGVVFHWWTFGTGGRAPSGKTSEPSRPPEPPVAP